MNREKFELLSVEEMRLKYGLTAENRTYDCLNPKNIPECLRHLIHFAELWGVNDDLIRDDMVRKASPDAIDDLKSVIEAHEDLLDEWLAGPEALSPQPSKEYLAFSAMRMTADFA